MTCTTDGARRSLRPLASSRRPGIDRVLAMRPQIEGFAQRLVGDNLRNLFLLGSGGGYLTHDGLQFLMERRSRALPVFRLSSSEFIQRNPAALGPGSLAVVASNTGATTEVVDAARFARQRGAILAAATRRSDSPLARLADPAWTYEDGEGVGDPKTVALALLGLALLRAAGEMDGAEYADHVATLEVLPDALLAACSAAEETNAAIAAALRDAPIIYVLGSGPNHGTAYCLAMCYLQEMQWMHAASFNAAEFVHGAFEVVTDGTAVIQFIGEEVTRPIDERIRAFLEHYAPSNAHFVDARNLLLPGVTPAMRPFASHFALDAVMTRLADHFEAATGHDLDTRRYMTKVYY